MNKTIIQIGSHIGNTRNDPIFNIVNNDTKLILVEPVPYLFEQLKTNYNKKFNNNHNIIFINSISSLLPSYFDILRIVQLGKQIKFDLISTHLIFPN
jgi:cystathionine beta-lyase/cystathionine gamma-synthase